MGIEMGDGIICSVYECELLMLWHRLIQICCETKLSHVG